MGASSALLSPAVLMTFLVAVGSLMAYPEVVTAKHAGITRHYHFDIKLKSITRLCRTKSIVAVNGKFPGPRLIAREGDRLVVEVVFFHGANEEFFDGICLIEFICHTTGEWFNADPEAVINQSLQTGAGPNVSDAYTLNGLPGPLYNCSSKGI
ncbi:hypothetical protein SCA6_010236 [Theobroma cacao]